MTGLTNGHSVHLKNVNSRYHAQEDGCTCRNAVAATGPALRSRVRWVRWWLSTSKHDQLSMDSAIMESVPVGTALVVDERYVKKGFFILTSVD